MANHDLLEIEQWLNAMKLKMNIDKSLWLMIAKNVRDSAGDYEIKIGNQNIERVKSTKYLGFEIGFQ